MLGSLQAGLTGMQAHQTYLDVIGDNLANSNTTAFKSSRVTFADLFSNTIRTATQPTSTLGGKNPSQVGAGSLVSSIDMKMTQGAVLPTGRPFDIGIQGEGFFVLSDDTNSYYTRAGTFGLDGDDYLVDLRTGMRIQSPTLQDIQIQANETLPPTATTEIDLTGALPALVTGPLEEIVTSSDVFLDGTPAQITGTNTQPFALADGESLLIRVNGGAAQQVVFNAVDFVNIAAATAAEVAAVFNSSVTGITATVSGGAVVLTTENTGESSSIDIDNDTGTPATTLGLTLSMVAGTETAATAATQLNDLVANKANYVAGDIINITGTDANGLTIQALFTYGVDGTTLGDLQTLISATYTGATCTIDPNGNLVLTADSQGDASLSLILQDDQTATGNTLWPTMTVTQDGTEADQETTSVTIYNAVGITHTLVLTFTRVDALNWSLTAQVNNASNITVTNNINSVQFNSDGSFNTIYGTGNTVELYDSDLNSTQIVTLDLGTAGGFDGLIQVGNVGSVTVSGQNGYAAGQLAAMSVEQNGEILGHYSNGQFDTLGQIGLARFSNPEGLFRIGDTLFHTTPNSGNAVLMEPGSGGSGKLIAGSLEQSNVDIAEEFVNLIEAQRGFQANARIITTSDEILHEMVNLV